ncbi:hypothetical protein BGZ72_000255 [Mortierella alpina]|nr:hypothetical protein BGZ72_000255 [Mortierella alpina]
MTVSAWELYSECTTNPQSGTGSTSCTAAAWSTLTAPEGHVFNDKPGGFQEHFLGESQEARYEVHWDDYVEILPETQFMYPRTIRFRAYARTRGGASRHGTRAWSKVRIFGGFMKYK